MKEKQGWVRNDNGVLEPMWSLRSVLPQCVVVILEKAAGDLGEKNEGNEAEENEEMRFEEVLHKV